MPPLVFKYFRLVLWLPSLLHSLPLKPVTLMLLLSWALPPSSAGEQPSCGACYSPSLADTPWPAAVLAVLRLSYREKSICAEQAHVSASLEYQLHTFMLSIQGLGSAQCSD